LFGYYWRSLLLKINGVKGGQTDTTFFQYIGHWKHLSAQSAGSIKVRITIAAPGGRSAPSLFTGNKSKFCYLDL